MTAVGRRSVLAARWPLLTGGGALALMVVLSWRVLRLDWYFDEMWRVDMVRNRNPFAKAHLIDTPIPPGWLGATHAALWGLPDGRVVLRVLAMVPAAVGATLLGDVLRRVLRQQRWPHPAAMATAVVWLTCLVPVLARQHLYFNNYGTDLLFGGLIVWATYRMASDGRAIRLLVATVALAPLFTMGALFLVPVALWAMWQHRDEVRRAVRPALLVGAAAVAASGAAVAWFGFYGPASESGTITAFWGRNALHGSTSIGSFVRRWFAEAHSGLVPSRTAHLGAVPTIAVLACLAGGGVLMARAWRRWWWFVLCGQGLALAASVVVGWPATFVRVNEAWAALVAMLVPLGLVAATVLAARRLAAAAPAGAIAGAVAAVATLAAAAVWPSATVEGVRNPAAFARGLTQDLYRLHTLMGPRAVVVSYHFMSHWYTDDVLVHDGSDTVTVLREQLGDESLYDDLDREVARVWEPGDEVWCVIPFEVGPDAALRACALTMPGMEKVFEERMSRAIVVGWRQRTG